MKKYTDRKAQPLSKFLPLLNEVFDDFTGLSHSYKPFPREPQPKDSDIRKNASKIFTSNAFVKQ